VLPADVTVRGVRVQAEPTVPEAYRQLSLFQSTITRLALPLAWPVASRLS